MQLSGFTFIVAALLFNLSLGSPITPRRLEARAASPIAARRLEVRAVSPIAARRLEVRAASPIAARRLEVREASPIAARRLEVREEAAVPVEVDCSKYKFKPTAEVKENKRMDALCPKFCEEYKKNPESPASKLFEKKFTTECAIPPAV
ncbi:hypothetical protein TWF281_007169 [Arthrobotrys megalospora]